MNTFKVALLNLQHKLNINESEKLMSEINDDLSDKSNDESNQKFNITRSQINSNNKVKRMNSLNLKKLRNNAIPGKEGIEKKIRKNAKKTKTHLKIDNKIKIKKTLNLK